MRRVAAATAAILAAGGLTVAWGFGASAASVPLLGIGDVKIVEGHSGSRSAVFSVTLSRPAVSRVTASYRTGDGSARAGSDYRAGSGTLVIPAGTTSAAIKVPVVGDTRVEALETFKVRITAAVNATITRSQGTATIENDDAVTSATVTKVSVGDASVVEGDRRGRYLRIPVTLSAKTIRTVTVGYRTVDGTARSSSDYAARSGTIRIPADTTGTSIAILVNGDTAVESGEMFEVRLTSATVATIGRGRGRATIVNDDSTPPSTAAPTTTTTSPAGGATAWGWGLNLHGEAGDGTWANRSSPVQSGNGSTWASISAGANHTCAIRADGTAWCWGFNENGELGDGTDVSRNSPVQVAGGATNWATVSAGGYHTCATRTDGTLWCWGLGGEQVAGTEWETVSAGFRHTCATRADGTLWCWGDNTYGQVGDGTTTLRNSPVQVESGVTNWATVGAGGRNTCATRTDGTLWCWGDNTYGQVGDGTTTRRTSPVPVAGDATNWARVSSGGLFTCATRTDGTAWCWGSNDVGQVGDGSNTDRWTPVQVSGGATNWALVSAQGIHVCATRSDGTAWCWGYNEYGQLGDGTVISRSGPVRVGSASDWASIDAGGLHAVGLRDP